MDMGKRERFLDPIPDEYQIFEQRLEVVGIQHRKKAAQRFATGNQQRLKLKPEPSNEYDPNAISVIESGRTPRDKKERHISDT